MKSIGFDFHGIWIANPYEDDGAQEGACDPIAFYGFQLVHTGGGFTALQKTLPDGTRILLTDDCESPAPGTPVDQITIGHYDSDGEEIACRSLAENIALDNEG